MSAAKEPSPDREAVAELPPSATLVLFALRENGALSSGGIREETFLGQRTVTQSLRRLKDAGLITSRPCLTDARKTLHEMADGVDPWGGGD